ncbi:MAG: hypothetical protein AAF791_08050 [Bacteroidota bacterium]
MPHLLALVLAIALVPGTPATTAPQHRATIPTGPAYLLIEGTLTCEQFDATLERLVRHPHVHEFEGSRCRGGEVQMVVEFRFDSRADRANWVKRPQTQALLRPLYRDLRDSKVQFLDRPRDLCASIDDGFCSRLSPDLRARIPASVETGRVLPSGRLKRGAPDNQR